MEFTIKKNIDGKAIDFVVKAEEGREGWMSLSYKMPGVEENNTKGTDGYFNARGLNRELKAIEFWSAKKINGRKIGGFRIPQDIFDQLADYEETLKRKKRERIEAEQRAIREGETPITVNYHDGEYLSGYSVHGYAATLLTEIGLARYIEGWGTKVNTELVDKLGTEFTYPQAVEFARPIIEEKKRKEEEARQKAEAEEAKKRPMSKEREQQYSVEVGEVKRVDGGEGPDYVSEIVVTSPEGKQHTFSARNIFDFGLVITPEGGGLVSYEKGEWVKEQFDERKGWYKVNLPQDEKEAYWIAQKNIPSGLRGIRL